MGYHHFALLMVVLLASCCKSQDPNDVNLILKTVIDTQLVMVSQLKELQNMMAKLEEQSTAMSSLQQCCSGSRDQMAELQDMFVKDECYDHSHNCSEFASCKDSLIYYECTCLPGFSGDGFTCVDIDECSENTYQCSERATCTNIQGNYTCTCQEGFELVNNTCEDIDECEMGNHACEPHATCINTIGNYTCSTCEWPFSFLNGVGCIKLVTDELKWEAAQANCQSMGSTLFEAESPEQYQRLAKHFRNTIDRDFIWVGVKGGKWVTSGVEVAREIWRTGDPNDGSSAKGYLRQASSYKLGDLAVERDWWSLCQKY